MLISTFLVMSVIASYALCQQLPVGYNVRSVAGAGVGLCAATQDVRENIKQNIRSLINDSILPVLMTQNQTQMGSNTSLGYGTCGCGGSGWRRAAYLNMSDPTQTCPPAWELITTPRRSCARPSYAGSLTCYSAMFPTQGISFSQVCGKITGYQVGQPGAFILEGTNSRQTIDGPYVDGVSLTYGSPRQHIWTFANALDEPSSTNDGINYQHRCPCTNTAEQRPIPIPSFIGNDYFCETGVPPGQRHANSIFYPNDPLWDGQGCGATSTCCTFNNPPWFCKQLSQSTNADLEVRLCSANGASLENTPIQLIEIYVK